MKTSRIIIYPKDVQRITGKSEKSKNQFISVNDFAEFTGLTVEEITSYLKD